MRVESDFLLATHTLRFLGYFFSLFSVTTLFFLLLFVALCLSSHLIAVDVVVAIFLFRFGNCYCYARPPSEQNTNEKKNQLLSLFQTYTQRISGHTPLDIHSILPPNSKYNNKTKPITSFAIHPLVASFFWHIILGQWLINRGCPL